MRTNTPCGEWLAIMKEPASITAEQLRGLAEYAAWWRPFGNPEARGDPEVEWCGAYLYELIIEQGRSPVPAGRAAWQFAAEFQGARDAATRLRDYYAMRETTGGVDVGVALGLPPAEAAWFASLVGTASPRIAWDLAGCVREQPGAPVEILTDCALVVEMATLATGEWDSDADDQPVIASGPELTRWLDHDVRTALEEELFNNIWKPTGQEWHALLNRSEAEGKPVRDVRWHEVVAAVALAEGAATRPQTIRQSAKWRTGANGKKAVAIPRDVLKGDALKQWLLNCAKHIARAATLFDEPDNERCAVESEWEIARVWGIPLQEPEQAADDPAVAAPYDFETCHAIALLMDDATKAQCRFLDILFDYPSASDGFIARRMRLAPATIRVMRRDIVKRIRKAGITPVPPLWRHRVRGRVALPYVKTESRRIDYDQPPECERDT